MGQAHFKQMFNDALANDMRAMLGALLRCEEARMLKIGRLHAKQRYLGTGGSALLPLFWDMPFDQIMQLSRGLSEIDAQFSGVLIEMIASGRAQIRIPVTSGKYYKTDSPAALTFDELQLTERLFHELLMHYPKDSISGNTNEETASAN